MKEKEAKEKAAKEGDMLSVEYTASLEDGKVIDSCVGKKPLQIELGKKSVIKGVEEALMGMSPGQDKTVTLKPDQAYGERNEQLVQTVPREALKANKEEIEIKPGTQLILKDHEGRSLLATITKTDPEKLTIDLNHPLAGKTIQFKLKLLSIA